ncbi:MAG: PIN domain-containing protein, partial [Rhodospirillales bacterium]
MVIDTSAILAMLFDEPEADEFERLVEADPVVLVSAVSRVEAAFV